MKKQNINEIFRKWGKGKQDFPKNDIALKEEILSKVPFSVENYRKIERKKKTLPWISMAFATMAILVLIGNTGFQSKKMNYITGMSLSIPSTSSINNKVQMEMSNSDKSEKLYKESSAMKLGDIYNSVNSIQISPRDNREFLKTNYNANIKTRNIVDMIDEIEITVRGFSGRINSINSSEKNGYVSFSIPADQFEMFRNEIKSLTNAKLFVEEKNSTNMLPQKQYFEREHDQVSNNITDYKNQKAQLTKNNSQVVASYNSRISGLNEEMKFLQTEWTNATYNRRIEINSRLTQIQEEKNIIQNELASENKNYNIKLISINQNIKNLEMNLQNIEQQDQNLVDDVATVDGTISLEWISLWKLVDTFIPGPLLAWMLVVVAGVSFWIDRRSMRVFE